MSYHRRNSTLIARRRRNDNDGMGAWTDTLKDIGKGAINIYSQGQQAQGAAAAQAQANKDLAAALAAQRGGISTETMLIGAAAVGAVLLIASRRRKS